MDLNKFLLAGVMTVMGLGYLKEKALNTVAQVGLNAAAKFSNTIIKENQELKKELAELKKAE